MLMDMRTLPIFIGPLGGKSQPGAKKYEAIGLAMVIKRLGVIPTTAVIVYKVGTGARRCSHKRIKRCSALLLLPRKAFFVDNCASFFRSLMHETRGQAPPLKDFITETL